MAHDLRARDSCCDRRSHVLCFSYHGLSGGRTSLSLFADERARSDRETCCTH